MCCSLHKIHLWIEEIRFLKDFPDRSWELVEDVASEVTAENLADGTTLTDLYLTVHKFSEFDSYTCIYILSLYIFLLFSLLFSPLTITLNLSFYLIHLTTLSLIIAIMQDITTTAFYYEALMKHAVTSKWEKPLQRVQLATFISDWVTYELKSNILCEGIPVLRESLARKCKGKVELCGLWNLEGERTTWAMHHEFQEKQLFKKYLFLPLLGGKLLRIFLLMVVILTYGFLYQRFGGALCAICYVL